MSYSANNINSTATYYYRVKARNSSGLSEESLWSDTSECANYVSSSSGGGGSSYYPTQLQPEEIEEPSEEPEEDEDLTMHAAAEISEKSRLEQEKQEKESRNDLADLLKTIEEVDEQDDILKTNHAELRALKKSIEKFARK